MQDPQLQLLELGLAVPDAIDPRRTAVLDPAHRSFVDHEVFFFADEADKRRFDADPTGSCGVVTDPVSKRRFRPGIEAPRSEFGGRAYIFIDEAAKAAFERDPESFARPNYDAIEVPGMR